LRSTMNSHSVCDALCPHAARSGINIVK
jgi:hypothetical protein